MYRPSSTLSYAIVLVYLKWKAFLSLFHLSKRYAYIALYLHCVSLIKDDASHENAYAL